jgi:CRISPR/Cas system CSM-associated protein Csm3 (group 7 of RAMP superfamily)
MPGNSLKGVLRTWLKKHATSGELNTLLDLFGYQIGEDGTGGRVTFYDAIAIPPSPEILGFLARYPMWDPQRLAAVVSNVAIHRTRQTARHQKLFYTEFVPADVSFGIEIDGVSNEDEWTREVALLLRALEASGKFPIELALGSNTTNGWGQWRWSLDAICRTTPESVKNWLVGFDSSPTIWKSALQPVDSVTSEQLRADTAASVGSWPATKVRVFLRLQFSGPFLVNDVTKTKDFPNSGSEANHAPALTHDGRVLLRAESIRGRLRAQAERIIRTLHPEMACDITDPVHACGPVFREDDLGNVCLACALFGTTGWASPIDFSDFRSPENAPRYSQHTLLRQEHVAIDRFDGGGVDAAKFNTSYVESPLLEGEIHLDTFRMKEWQYGLLALLLRDLVEGDLAFGFGSNKGYGACKASVQVDIPGNPSVVFPGETGSTTQELVRSYVRRFREFISVSQTQEASTCHS